MGDANAQHPVQVKIVPPLRSEFPMAAYANYVLTSNTETEVTLDFGQLAPPLNESELAALGAETTLPFRPVARIAISHNLLEPLIKALEERKRLIDEQKSMNQSEVTET